MHFYLPPLFFFTGVITMVDAKHCVQVKGSLGQFYEIDCFESQH